LGKRHTTNLIEQLTKDITLPPPVLAQIVKRSDGIPLFIEELTKNILENPLMQRGLGGTGLDASSLTQLDIPPSLQASLMARLDRLAPIKEVAQIGAAIGREFSYDVLAAVSMRTEPELDAALQRLADAGIIFRRGSTHRAPCIFKHALIQDAAYSTMLRDQRQELHKRVATVLENQFGDIRTKQPEILAYHCAQGGMLEAAIRYGREAAEQSLRRSASVEAEQHLSGALGIIQQLPHSTQRDEWELRLFLARGRVVRISDGISAEKTLNAFTRARELISELTALENQLEVLYGLWGVHYVRAEHIAARDVATECLALAERHSSQAAYATANYIVASSLWATGAISEARRHIETVFEPLASVAKGLVPVTRLASNHDIAARFFFSSALAALGYLRLAGEIGEEVVQRAKSSGHVPLMAAALYFKALFEVQFGCEPEKLKVYGAEAVDFCTRHGVTVYGLWGRICYGIGLSRSGDAEQAIPLIESAMQSAEEIDAKLFRPLHLGELALAYDQCGRSDVALSLIEKAMGLVAETQERMCEAELYRIHGSLLLSNGDEKAAEYKLMRSLETARLQDTRFWQLRAALSLCKIWNKRGSFSLIRETLDPLCADLNGEADNREISEARALLAALRD
jgi:tetratricopeptide (TPR) repeat protein